jgi:hypothetical protein
MSDVAFKTSNLLGPFPLTLNPKMEKRAPRPGPLPIGSADSADAERENRYQLPGKAMAEFCFKAFAQKKSVQRLFPLPAGEGQGEGEACLTTTGT